MDTGKSFSMSSSATFGDKNSLHPESDGSVGSNLPSSQSNYLDLKKGKSMGIFLKVIIGKTVEAYKVSDGMFLSHCKAGVAILGNEGQSRYDLYVYKEDQQKVTSARITPRFKFEVHPHHYGLFYDNSAMPWSLRFDCENDMVEFIEEIALARWKSVSTSDQIIVQDVLPGESRKKASAEDIIHASCDIYSLTSKTRLKRVSSKDIESVASARVWSISSPVGMTVHSRRFILVPSDIVAGETDWADCVPQGCHLFLDLFIKAILPTHSIKSKMPNLSSLRSESGGSDGGSKREELTSRLVKMGGQALVPFPAFPSEDEAVEASEASLMSLDQPNDLLKPAPAPPSDRSSPPLLSSAPPVHSHDRPIRISPYSTNATIANAVDDGYRPDLRLGRDAEFNMLFSEVTTCNSELRMGLMRVTDKVDSLLNKTDKSSYDRGSFERIEPISADIRGHLSRQNAEIKNLLDSKLRLIAEQNQTILDMFIEQQKCKGDLLQKIEVMHDDVMNSVLNIQMTQTPITNQQVTLDDRLSTKENSIYQEELTTSLQHLQERNSYLEAARVDLELTVSRLKAEADTAASHLDTIAKLQMKNSELAAHTEELEEKLNLAEKEIERLKSEKCSVAMSQPVVQVTDVVRKLMNQAYRSLKAQLGASDPSVIDTIATTLRLVTNSYLEKNDLAERPKSQEVESGRFSPTSSPLPPIGASEAAPLPLPRARPPPPLPTPLKSYEPSRADSIEIPRLPDIKAAPQSDVTSTPLPGLAESKDLEDGDARFGARERFLSSCPQPNSAIKTECSEAPLSSGVHSSVDGLEMNKGSETSSQDLENYEYVINKYKEVKESLTQEDEKLSEVSFSSHNYFKQATSDFLAAETDTLQGNLPSQKGFSKIEDCLGEKVTSIQKGEEEKDWWDFGSAPSEDLKEKESEPLFVKRSESNVFAPLLTTEPPPLPPGSISSSPSPPPSLKGGETYTVVTSQSESSPSKASADEDWRPAPPPLIYEEKEDDEDAWLFNS